MADRQHHHQHDPSCHGAAAGSALVAAGLTASQAGEGSWPSTRKSSTAKRTMSPPADLRNTTFSASVEHIQRSGSSGLRDTSAAGWNRATLMPCWHLSRAERYWIACTPVARNALPKAWVSA